LHRYKDVCYSKKAETFSRNSSAHIQTGSAYEEPRMPANWALPLCRSRRLHTKFKANITCEFRVFFFFGICFVWRYCYSYFEFEFETQWDDFFFILPNPCSRTMAPGFTRPLPQTSTISIK
jgi:hypothetical protein